MQQKLIGIFRPHAGPTFSGIGLKLFHVVAKHPYTGRMLPHMVLTLSDTGWEPSDTGCRRSDAGTEQTDAGTKLYDTGLGQSDVG